MGSYFAANSEQFPFIMFSTAHLVSLACLAVVVGILFGFRGRLRRKARLYAGVRYGLAALLFMCEISLDVWNVTTGEWTLRDSLPLQLCSVTLLLSIIMLLTRSYRLFEFVFFAGILGALQALLTPALDYAFPHYRFIEFMVVHIAIIAASLFMVAGEGYRPRLASIGIAMLGLNILILPVFVVNWMTGGNYMFLMRKPANASLLDVLGPWPWYLLSLEAIAVLMFCALYAPFHIRNIRNRREQPSYEE